MRRATADVGTRGRARGGLVRADLGRAVADGGDGEKPRENSEKHREKLQKPRENSEKHREKLLNPRKNQETTRKDLKDDGKSYKNLGKTRKTCGENREFIMNTPKIDGNTYQIGEFIPSTTDLQRYWIFFSILMDGGITIAQYDSI